MPAIIDQLDQMTDLTRPAVGQGVKRLADVDGVPAYGGEDFATAVALATKADGATTTAAVATLTTAVAGKSPIGHTHVLSSITDAGTAAARNVGTAAGNLPALDLGGKLSPGLLPALAITDTYVVNTQAAMLALSAETGDVAVRTDLSKTYILKGSDPTVLANWTEVLSPLSPVQSVNGLTGAVTLTTSNIAEAGNLYFTDSRASAAMATALNGKLDKSGGTLTGALNLAAGVINKIGSDNLVASSSGNTYLYVGSGGTLNVNNQANTQTNLRVTNAGAVTTFNNTLDNGGGAATFTGSVTAQGVRAGAGASYVPGAAYMGKDTSGGFLGLWLGATAGNETTSNYSILSDGNGTIFNTPGSYLQFRVANDYSNGLTFSSTKNLVVGGAYNDAGNAKLDVRGTFIATGSASMASAYISGSLTASSARVYGDVFVGPQGVTSDDDGDCPLFLQTSGGDQPIVIAAATTPESTAVIDMAKPVVCRSTIAPRAYTVATLPTPGTARRIAYASNARNPTEGSGAGTGSIVVDNGTAWRIPGQLTAVAA